MSNRYTLGRPAARPFYPLLISGGFILTLHRDAALPAEALMAPLMVVVICVLIVQLLLSAIARDSHVGAYITLSVLSSLAETLIGVAMIAGAGALVAISLVRPRVKGWWRYATRGLNAFSSLFAGVSLALAVPAGSLIAVPPQHSAPAAPHPGAPNIVIILVDGYPRNDSLAEDFGIDNRQFLDELEAAGFDVAERSRSNYNMTQLTLASMLNMRHVRELDGVDPSLAPLDQYRALSRAIGSAAVLRSLRQHGYETLTVASPFSSATIYQADKVVQNHALTDFEIGLISRSSLSDIAPNLVREWVSGWYRDAIRSDIDSIRSMMTESRARPTLVIGHLLLPHPPLVFGPSGEGQATFDCYPRHCEFWDSGWRYGADGLGPLLRGQLQFVNEQILDLVRLPQAGSRPTVTLLMSDHGYRFGPNEPTEAVRNLFAARTPGHPALFPDDATPINVFPRLLRAYFGAEVALKTEESYWLDLSTTRTEGILTLERVEP